ncbi:ATP-binding protein [Marinomonas mediterranea]|jgi:signal transduction histidine kinase (EC 2.7.13.3)|uniref:histidine kinase n=1 Tax=Marinomonas mediterranea (strain ATCC 700492 / JCM 21426 / NBRC 103028 / MMB-1) TaxID=717774 RepID=F2K037_MARM1|nr:ATP-binding protein [Marinomonas mediterranea]ADZ93251.1 integral membrane sensor signal transduction histidine kinase [Marinomonas mediterranea MMB-1]WCN11139.1 HAMP domain-containing protein [Marinomonas mediterranea]WCN15202.1 HAMP domain-containing protein [Marinomonas mediterranea]WCN19246.1 HAMP domain-containing protein [Marinomonas mediterranea MMB-1]
MNLLNSRLKRWSQSLTGQILIIMAFGVASAQLVSSAIWLRQLQADTEKNVQEVSTHMAFRIAATVSYFSSLPQNYRHIVIDQLQDMGGTRFFVTLNKEYITIDALPESKLKRIVKDEIHNTLSRQLGIHTADISFSSPDNLRVINNQTKLSDLPERWGHHSLMMKPLTPPIVIIQIQVSESEWLYLASLMPAPYFLDESSLLTADRLFSLTASVITVLLLTLLFIRRTTRPLALLAHAAEQFGKGDWKPLKEDGALEVRKTAHAFNDMQKRIQRYVDDRERLFASISHDLKTPITRLRLRAEMLDEDEARDAMVRDLEDLDMLVKGALQSVKETDIHENRVELDLERLLKDIQSSANIHITKVQVFGQLQHPYVGKPLAIKRCLGNLIDNALYYGNTAEIFIEDTEDTLCIRICDKGPGIPLDKIDKVFQPYTRLVPEHSGHHPTGMGLGLSIARNIARAHGGEVSLSNRPKKGLEAKLLLPRH